MPFLSTFIKGAAAAGDATSGSSNAPPSGATDEEPLAEMEAGGASNDTAGERAEAPQAPVPDLYDLDLDKVDTLLDEDSVWVIATYAGEPVPVASSRSFADDHRARSGIREHLIDPPAAAATS